jgi:zinc protease
MKNFLLLTSLSLASISNTFAQAKFIEKIEPKANEIIIPYEKYVLSNGLTVLIHEDHSDPICHVDVTYHVGSNREEIGRSGFAHFFEHMMFQGSDNVADEQHFKIVTESGGTLNGTTNSDRTNYFETMPSNQLEIGIWLEADRMGFLLDAVTQKKFEVQRATVKNERGQNYDNRPYGLVGEKLGRALYPYGHPYSWSTIGDLIDLDRVDVNDLKQFFMRWYGPNNATLTVAGDVNKDEVLKMAQKYFEPIPRGPEVNNMTATPFFLEKDRYISYEDNVKFPMIEMNFVGVKARHSDEVALDALAYYLGGDKSSPMYQTFVKGQLAMSAESYNPTRELGGEFVFSVMAMPGSKLADIEKKIKEIILDFEKTGMPDEVLTRFKNETEASYIKNLTTVSGKAAMLASLQTFTGNPNYLTIQLQQLKDLKKEDVVRVYNTYIKGKYAAIMSCVPKGKADLIAAADNFVPKPTNPADADHKEYQGLVYNKAKDTFNRNIKPNSGPNPILKTPVLFKNKYENGLKIIGTQSTEAPITNIQIVVNCGHRFEMLNKAGVAQLMASMLGESTTKRTAEQIADDLAKLGSEISINSGTQEMIINVSCLTKNIDATLAILEEKMFMPKFDKEDFERLKEEQLQLINNQSTQPVVVANNIYNKLLFGNSFIMGVATIGTQKTVSELTLEDVKAHYTKYFSSNLSTLVSVSNLTKEEIYSKIEFLKKWENKNVTMPADIADGAVETKTKIFLINKDKAAQSEIRIGYLSMPYDATGDYYKSYVMNYALGGAFNSRINLNLREDKGWTYGARSNFSGTQYKGAFTAGAGIKADKSDSAVVEFVKELRKFSSTGISKEELEFTKSSLSQSEALKYESPMQKAGFLKRISDYNLKDDFTMEQAKILQAITKEDIDKLAQKNLPLDKMVITIVGDKLKIKDNLMKLGYEVVEMDNDGNTVVGSDNNNQPLYKK